METSFNSWNGLWSLFILLVAVYFILWVLLLVAENFGRRDLTKKKVIDYLKTGLVFYRIVALAVLLLGFISINYITHSLLLIVLGVFGYSHIRNYIVGSILQIENVIKKGDTVKVGEFEGEIERLLPFGLAISTQLGEHYFNYVSLEANGFTVKSGDDNPVRATMFLNTSLSQEEILDLLFENPILDFDDHPTLQTAEQPNEYKLQYTLEKGGNSEELMAYLREHNITITKTAPTEWNY